MLQMIDAEHCQTPNANQRYTVRLRKPYDTFLNEGGGMIDDVGGGPGER